MEYRLIILMNVYNMELVQKKEIRNYVLPINMVYFLFTVDMLFSLMLMFVYLQKLLHCLIIYSYKANPSFLPCPRNLRSIGPSDFKLI